MLGVNGGRFDTVGSEVVITFQSGAIIPVSRIRFECFIESGYGKLHLEEVTLFAKLLPGRFLHITHGKDEVKLAEQELLHKELKL